MTTAPATRTKRHWLQRPAFRGIAGSGTLPVAINTERARRFLERLRQRQSLGRALALGLPAVAAMGLIWGVVNGMSGVSLEWLPLAGMGYVLGTCVRAAGKGIDHRFGVAGAALTLLGCMVSRLLALWIVVPSQVSGRNFSLLQDAPLDVSLRLLIDGTDAYSVAALAASVCQGYYFALYRITPQEMSYLADEGPPR